MTNRNYCHAECGQFGCHWDVANTCSTPVEKKRFESEDVTGMLPARALLIDALHYELSANSTPKTVMRRQKKQLLNNTTLKVPTCTASDCLSTQS